MPGSIMGNKKLHVVIAAVIIICVIGMTVVFLNTSPEQNPADDNAEEELLLTFEIFNQRLWNQRENVDETLTSVVELIAGTRADDPKTAQILMGLYAQSPNIISLLRIDETGKTAVTVPDTLSGEYEYQLPAKYLDPSFAEIGTTIDLLPNTVTGAYDTVLIIPIESSDKTYQGVLLSVINTHGFLSKILAETISETGYSATVLTPDGRIIYSGESSFIGMNAASEIKTNPEFAGLNQKIINDDSGILRYTTYNIGQLQRVDRVAAWETKSNWGNVKVIFIHDVSGTTNLYVPTESSHKGIEEFSIEAFRYIKSVGKERALQEFNDQKGRFTTKEYSVAAFTINGTVLALPYRQDLIGVDRSTSLDAYSVPIFKMEQMRALQGGGYTLFLLENPTNNMESELLLSYLMPVDDEWFILVQTYLGDIDVKIDPEVRHELSTFVRSLHQFIRETGKEEAILTLNNVAGTLANPKYDIQYLAMDYEGKLLVFPERPDLVGGDGMGMTDVYGGSIMRDLMIYAQEGGGFMYQYIPDTETGQSKLHLVYVEPINDEWFISANVPLT